MRWLLSAWNIIEKQEILISRNFIGRVTLVTCLKTMDFSSLNFMGLDNYNEYE